MELFKYKDDFTSGMVHAMWSKHPRETTVALKSSEYTTQSTEFIVNARIYNKSAAAMVLWCEIRPKKPLHNDMCDRWGFWRRKGCRTGIEAKITTW